MTMMGNISDNLNSESPNDSDNKHSKMNSGRKHTQ